MVPMLPVDAGFLKTGTDLKQEGARAIKARAPSWRFLKEPPKRILKALAYRTGALA